MKAPYLNVPGILLLLTLVSSCTIPAQLELYNNSGAQVTVLIGDVKTIIAPSETALFSEFYLNGLGVSVVGPDKTFVYRFERLPLSHVAFIRWGPFTKRIMRAQLESNGAIWAVGTGKDFPVIGHENQPEGFPVQPQKVSAMRSRGGSDYAV